MIMKRRRHWYFIYSKYCVLCGRETTDRVRRYTQRPRKWQDRHEISETACMDHFL